MLDERTMQAIAIARLCGVEGADKEIAEKYREIYEQISKSQQSPGVAKVEVFSRPF